MKSKPHLVRASTNHFAFLQALSPDGSAADGLALLIRDHQTQEAPPPPILYILLAALPFILGAVLGWLLF